MITGKIAGGVRRPVTLRCDPDAAAIDIELVVTARRPVRLPAGLHPTFRLPPEPGRVALLLGRHDGIFSYPINPGATHTRLLPDGWTVVTKDQSLSAQWEHTIAVTEHGFEVLTLGAGETAPA